MPDNQEIHFLSVDLESLDLQVLKSNNWKKYRPTYMPAEILNSTLKTLAASEIHALLPRTGYDP